MWLRDDRIAQCVVKAFRFGQAQLHLYTLQAYVIMPNHVHLLIEPTAPLSRITRCLKGYTAREANKILGRTGTPFWQYESYDHWVRHQTEFQKIVRYIERNPAKAGFVNQPEDWPWSSVHVE